MAQKPNFLKKLISAGLVTASTATIVAGFAGSAMGAAVNKVVSGNTLFSTGANMAPAGAVPAGIVTLQYDSGGAYTTNVDVAGVTIQAIDTDQGNKAQALGVTTLNQDVTIGSISHTAANVNLYPIALNGKTATLTGTAGTGPTAGILANIYDALGPVDMATANSTLAFNLTGTTQAAPSILTNATILNGATGTMNITKGFVQAKDASFATINKINIADDQGFIFSNVGGAGNIILQANGATVNFNGANGTGKLVLKGDGANGFVVQAGSLGGAGKGVIEFDTTANAATIASNGGAATPLIGGDNAANRAAQFIVTTGGANAATITGQVFAKNVTLNGGPVNFGHIVDVGTDGTTAFKTAASKVAITQNSNFGATDFGNLAVQITVPDTMTLTGNFTGDASNNANTNGVITFAANGALASTSADANAPVTSNITAIEAAGVGTVQLSGTHTAELRLGNAGSIFKLADGTVINGKVNQTALVGPNPLAGGSITLDGSATITGDIGNGGGNAPLQAITLANDASKTLTLGGTNIIGSAAPAAKISFQANGGTVKLTNTQNNVLLRYNLDIAADQKGVVDASSLTNNQTLTISGKIGTIAPGANKTLGQLNVGSSKTILSAGDAAINELVIGNNGSVQLAHDTYLITKTTNAAGQGKIIFNPTAGPATTLADGTNLGSAANPLAEINFAGNAAVEVGKGDNLYATNITTAAPNTGSFSFKAGGTNIVSGTVGGQQGNKFNTVTLDNGTTAQFLGNAIFNGASTIEAASTLQIGGNYTTDFITSADNTGIVEFVNADPITLTLNKQGAAVDDLKQITVSGPGNIVVNQTGNAANNGIETDTIAFANASLGAALFLPSGIPFDGLTITSTVGNKTATGFDAPKVFVSGADSIIANGQAIGDQKNIVGLGLASDNSITVNATTLYAGFGTTKDNQGTVTLSGGVPNTPGTIYGLGLENGDPKLKLVTVTTDYKNLGSTIATNLIINDGLTYQAGGVAGKDFDGTITLGSANGNSNVVFADDTNSTATSTVAALKANTGNVTYLGDADVGNIGSSNTPVASVQFTGPAGSEAALQGAIYSTVTNFGSSDLVVVEPNVILGGGTTAINGNIDLGTNTLTFASGTSTWGSNTSLTTQLTVSNGNIGHIVIAEGAGVNATTTGTTTINVQDTANANFSGTQTYTLIQGGARFNGTLGAPKFNVTGSNRFVNYGLIRAANQDYVITRTNDAAKVVTQDIASSQFAGVPNVGQNVTTFVNATNTAAYNNLLLAKNSADSANFVGAIVTDTSAAVTNANLEVAKDIQAHLGNRVNAVRYLGTPETAEMAGPEAGLTSPAAVAAGDEPVDNVAYGIWAKPFYTVADQDKKGGVAGYKAKTTGVVIGLDTLANDNLMVGAAIGITKTDIKHQDYKKGDKTDVNGFSFSLYGAQQLVENFFAQGSAIFSLNQVKNKSQRYFFDANGKMSKQIAAGNYDNMTFGGNLTVGYDYNAMEGVLVTPMAGLSYLKSSDESYKETGTTVANKQVNGKFSDRTDLIVGARVMGNTMNISDLMVYPEAHAFVVHKVNGRLSKTQSQLDGQVTPFISQPDRTAKTSYNLGLSASIRPDAKMEYGIGYDAQIASKYVAHQGTLKVRVNF